MLGAEPISEEVSLTLCLWKTFPMRDGPTPSPHTGLAAGACGDECRQGTRSPAAHLTTTDSSLSPVGQAPAGAARGSLLSPHLPEGLEVPGVPCVCLCMQLTHLPAPGHREEGCPWLLECLAETRRSPHEEAEGQM